jgi:stress-induced-phosphoprotein 1
MATQKELGTKAFQAKDYPTAIEHFTEAIKENPQDHTLFSNRSACFYNSNNFPKALEDGNQCV